MAQVEDDDDDDDWLSPEMKAMLAGMEEDDDAAPAAATCPHVGGMDDAGVLECSKDWVNAIVSDAGICPFSLSADRAGLPLGDVRYDVMREADAESSYARAPRGEASAAGRRFFVAAPPSGAGRGPAAGCHADIPSRERGRIVGREPRPVVRRGGGAATRPISPRPERFPRRRGSGGK